MKKIITLLLIASMLSCTACSDKTSENNLSEKDGSDSLSVVVDSGQQSENSVSDTTENTTEERFYDFHGLNMYEPDDMVMKFTHIGKHVWCYNYETKDNLNCAIVIDGINYSDFNDSYGLDDVWEILRSPCELSIGCVYQNIFKFYDAEVYTTEKVDFLGTEFMHSTGIIPFETYDDERIEINYSAYYGILDFPEYKSVPFMWIAFSDSDSDEIKAEMEKIVDDIAENASWQSDES